MSVWVVVGGQYGSEGKGKIAAFITLQEQIDICVRCGGPNSGHCFVDESGQNSARYDRSLRVCTARNSPPDSVWRANRSCSAQNGT